MAIVGKLVYEERHVWQPAVCNKTNIKIIGIYYNFAQGQGKSTLVSKICSQLHVSAL